MRGLENAYLHVQPITSVYSGCNSRKPLNSGCGSLLTGYECIFYLSMTNGGAFWTDNGQSSEP